MSVSVLKVGFRTAKSNRRLVCEDSLAVFQPKGYWQAVTCGSVFVVADGVGGKPLPAEASRLATQTIVSRYCQERISRVTYRLVRAISDANARLVQTSLQKRLPEGMSSTAVIAVIRGARAWVSNVGDSRCYLVRKRKARLLTQDHTFAAEGLRRKMFTPAQAARHPLRSSLTQALGMRSRVFPAVARTNLKPGDALLLCTDGLSDFVSEREVAQVLSAAPPQQAAQALVNLAIRRGTKDDCTALVVRVLAELPREALARRGTAQPPSRTVDSLNLAAGILLSFSLLGALILAALGA